MSDTASLETPCGRKEDQYSTGSTYIFTGILFHSAVQHIDLISSRSSLPSI